MSEKAPGFLKPLNVPQPLQVVTERGRPVAVVRNGKRLAIAQIRDRWRVDDTWWREPLSRMYFEFILEDGDLLTCFQDLGSGLWFRQRYP